MAKEAAGCLFAAAIFGRGAQRRRGGAAVGNHRTCRYDEAQPGSYPFRLLYEQSWGGANCEWVTVTPTGTHVLINDTSQGKNAVYAFLTATNSPIYVSGIMPVNGATGVSANANITAFVVDGNPAQVATAQMWVNGLRTTVNASRSNNVTTVVQHRRPIPVPARNQQYRDDCLHGQCFAFPQLHQFLAIQRDAPVLAGSGRSFLLSIAWNLDGVLPASNTHYDKTMYFLDWEPILPLGWTADKRRRRRGTRR